MKQKVPNLSVPDLARVKGDTPQDAASWIIDHFNQPGGSFNYVRGTRITKSSYRGLHKIQQLLAGCIAEHTEIGKKSNEDLVAVAAPVAFGRNTQVFDLSPRKFPFGRRLASYRIPFFFIENSKVIIYYLWPRKNETLTARQIGMIATIYKSFLLDTEFFGMQTDIEIIDASTPLKGEPRLIRQYRLDDIELWSIESLSDRLTLLSEAIDIAENSGEIKPRKRKDASIIRDMPLFS